MRTAILGSVLGLAVATASPVLAGDEVTCLWGRLPAAKRDFLVSWVGALFRSGPTPESAGAMSLGDEELGAAAAACRLPSEKEPRTVAVTYAIELAAGQWLTERRRLRPGDLERAWLAVAVDYFHTTRIADTSERQIAQTVVADRFEDLIGSPDSQADVSPTVSKVAILMFMAARYGRALIEGG